MEARKMWRIRIATVLSGFAIFLLITALGLIATVIISAKANGYLPEGPWGEWPENHGPWHRTFLLSFLDHDSPIVYFKTGLLSAFLLLISSVMISFLSLLVKFSRFRGAVFVCSIIANWSSFYYLYWLID
ncbi:MAG: hypothetical protein H8D67_04990 [Deltaproteobacteria bacterium]|nr:hypothetical protein [Deltaproteobacteria bacterium]